MKKFLIQFIAINILLIVNLKASYFISNTLSSEFKLSEITYPQLIDPSHHLYYDTLQSVLDNIAIPSDILNVSRYGVSSDKHLIFFDSLFICEKGSRYSTVVATIYAKINSVNVDIRNSNYRSIIYCDNDCNIENIKGSFIGNGPALVYSSLVVIGGSNRIGDMEVLFDNNLLSCSSLISNAGEIKCIKGNFIENEGKRTDVYNTVIKNIGYIGYLKGNFLNNIDCCILNNSSTMNVTGGFIGNKYSSSANSLIHNSNVDGKLTINDSIFLNNICECESNAFYALIENGGILVFNDSKFSGNYVRMIVPSGYEPRGGGVVSTSGRSTIDFNLSAGKKINNVGNYFEVNGKKENEFGGFLYMGADYSSNGVANFNIDKNASYIIGDGRSGYDSIASSGQSHIINKNGGGEVVVNSSMEFYTGTLNVNEGNMTVNNKLGASRVTIANGASLSAKVNGNGSTFTNAALNYSNDGTLNLIAGEALASGNYDVFVFENPETVYFGNVKSYGGTFDHATGTFIVENALNLTIGETNSVNVQSNGRILAVGGEVEDTSIIMNFNSTADVTVNSVFDTSK